MSVRRPDSTAPGEPAARGMAGIVRRADLHGLLRLGVDATLGVTDLVEALHHTIAERTGPLGQAPVGRTRGLTGFVYRSVRGVTRAVGHGIDATWRMLPAAAAPVATTPQREALLAVLNGVWGDQLAARGNPLAIPMALRQHGQALDLASGTLTLPVGPARDKLLVLVHGLCMNDLQWQRNGHDHGQALAHELGFTPVYLHYNSGRHVSENGAEFARMLQRLLDAWPVPLEHLVIVGHSMGGLVARSACEAARQSALPWLARLSHMVFLGTPHHGAALERAGNRVDLLTAISPYTKPFARLGRLRSAGIQDLRHGNLLDADWQPRPASHPHDARQHVPLPAGVACCAVAATRRAAPSATGGRLPGDGLVSVRSALGQHDDPRRTLAIAPERRCICWGLGHFDLLSSHDVYRHLRRWLDRDDAATED